MAKRRPTPLFEYVYRKDREASRPVAPTPVRKPEPRRAEPPRVEPRPASQRAENRAATGSALLAKFDPRRSVGVPVAGLYAFVAVVVIVAILVYGVAFQAGYTNAERKLVERIADSSGVKAPEGPVGGSPPALINKSGSQPRESKPTVQNTNNPGSGDSQQKPTPPSNGNVKPEALDPLTDSREDGSNYLHVVSRLSRDEAVQAATFLTENGVPAMAVNLDTASPQSNNRSTWSVYSRLGIPGGEFSGSSELRSQHKREVARLGTIWQRDHKGTSNFAENQTGWEKFRKGN